FENVSNDVHVHVVGQRFCFRSTESQRRHFCFDEIEERLHAVVMPALHESIAAKRDHFSFAAQVRLMATRAMSAVGLLATVGLRRAISAVPSAFFGGGTLCREGRECG